MNRYYQPHPLGVRFKAHEKEALKIAAARSGLTRNGLLVKLGRWALQADPEEVQAILSKVA